MDFQSYADTPVVSRKDVKPLPTIRVELLETGQVMIINKKDYDKKKMRKIKSDVKPIKIRMMETNVIGKIHPSKFNPATMYKLDEYGVSLVKVRMVNTNQVEEIPEKDFNPQVMIRLMK